MPRIFAAIDVRDTQRQRPAAEPRRRVHQVHRHDDAATPSSSGSSRRKAGRRGTGALTAAHDDRRGVRLAIDAMRAAALVRQPRARSGSCGVANCIRLRAHADAARQRLAQPLLFLFVLGAGLASLVGRRRLSGVTYQEFIFPGVLAMSVITSSLFSAIAIVWDREFGFMREMLVAPVSRTSLVLGKARRRRQRRGRAGHRADRPRAARRRASHCR